VGLSVESSELRGVSLRIYLHLLESDSPKGIRDLSRELGLPVSTVHYHVKKLKELAVLEGYGYTWQRFIKIMKYATENIIDWALYDDLEWGELVKILSKLLERYAGARG